MKLWDFLTAQGDNVILTWAEEERLSTRDRAILNQKLDRLAQIDFRLAIGTKMLAGPVHKHIYKLHVKGTVALRPLLCRGPIDNEKEYTLLCGAVERGGKLPKGVQEQAEDNRQEILRDPIKRRLPHERIPDRPKK